MLRIGLGPLGDFFKGAKAAKANILGVQAALIEAGRGDRFRSRLHF